MTARDSGSATVDKDASYVERVVADSLKVLRATGNRRHGLEIIIRCVLRDAAAVACAAARGGLSPEAIQDKVTALSDRKPLTGDL